MSGRDRPADVEALIDEFQRSGMRELHVRADGFELYLSNESGAAGIAAADDHTPMVSPARRAAPADGVRAPVAAPAPPAAVVVPEGATLVVAPYLGTFYRAPKPGSPSYVELDSRVTTETELCMVEVMKLFTGVRAPIAGRIVAIMAADGQMVEAGQPLFAIQAD